MDFGKKTLQDILRKKIGEKDAKQILDAVNDAYKEGIQGDDLVNLFRKKLIEQGHDASDSSYGCVIALA